MTAMFTKIAVAAAVTLGAFGVTSQANAGSVDRRAGLLPTIAPPASRSSAIGGRFPTSQPPCRAMQAARSGPMLVEAAQRWAVAGQQQERSWGQPQPS